MSDITKEELLEALGVLSCCAPSVVVEADSPLHMAQEILAYVENLKNSHRKLLEACEGVLSHDTGCPEICQFANWRDDFERAVDAAEEALAYTGTGEL